MLRKALATSLVAVFSLTGCSSQSGLLGPGEIGLPYEQNSYSSASEFQLVDSFGPDCQGAVGPLEQELRANSEFVAGQNINGTDSAIWIFTQYVFKVSSAELAADLADRFGAAAENCEPNAAGISLDSLGSTGAGSAWETTLELTIGSVSIDWYGVNAVVADGDLLNIVFVSAEEAVGLSMSDLQEITSKAVAN